MGMAWWGWDGMKTLSTKLGWHRSAGLSVTESVTSLSNVVLIRAGIKFEYSVSEIFGY